MDIKFAGSKWESDMALWDYLIVGGVSLVLIVGAFFASDASTGDELKPVYVSGSLLSDPAPSLR